MPYDYTCERCGQPFTRAKQLTKSGEVHQFCSAHCRIEKRKPIVVDDTTALLPLSGGKTSLISPEDAVWVAEFNWKSTKEGYVVRRARSWENSPVTTILLSREILKAPKGMTVDHINHNTLDNRRGNLRLATGSQNNGNMRVRSGSQTGYKGVHKAKKKNRYIAHIGRDGKRAVYLGCFTSAEDAARAYDKAAFEQWGEFAHLNFPRD